MMKKIVPEFKSKNSEFQILDNALKLKRIILYIFSKFIKTDEKTDKFPISLKVLVVDKKEFCF